MGSSRLQPSCMTRLRTEKATADELLALGVPSEAVVLVQALTGARSRATRTMRGSSAGTG